MQLPHGPENKQKRIDARVERFLQSGGHAGMEPDETDINSDEPAEIASAREAVTAFTGGAK